MIKITGVIAAIALALAAMALAMVVNLRGETRKIAFVNSQRMIEGFGPAYEIEKDLRKEEEDFKTRLKVKEDSLKVFLDSMTTKYNKSSAAVKKELQDLLSAKNQEINNIARGHARRMEQMRAEKMASVFQMINSYIKEYGEKNRYAMIFGTLQGGNIVFGDGTAADITQAVLDGLNERYK